MKKYIDKDKATELCAAFYVNRKDNHEFDAGARYAATQLLSLIKDLPDANVEERKEITLDDVLKYCKAHRLIVISEELFYRLNHLAKIPNRTEEQ